MSQRSREVVSRHILHNTLGNEIGINLDSFHMDS